MSDELVNQLTLNFLINKSQLQKLNKKSNCQEDKLKEIQTYKPRIQKLFDDLLVCNQPDDLLYDVKNSFDTFVNKSIYYFKAHDESIALENERNSEQIHDDIDYYEEERAIERGDYVENDNVKEEEEEEEEEEENDEDDNDVPKFNKTVISGDVDYTWFNIAKQQYKKHKIIPRKKEI